MSLEPSARRAADILAADAICHRDRMRHLVRSPDGLRGRSRSHQPRGDRGDRADVPVVRPDGLRAARMSTAAARVHDQRIGPRRLVLRAHPQLTHISAHRHLCAGDRFGHLRAATRHAASAAVFPRGRRVRRLLGREETRTVATSDLSGRASRTAASCSTSRRFARRDGNRPRRGRRRCQPQ